MKICTDYSRTAFDEQLHFGSILNMHSMRTWFGFYFTFTGFGRLALIDAK